MKKLMVLAVAALLCGLMVPATGGAVDLIADGRGTHFDAGDVTFSSDGSGLTVTVTAAAPWCFKDVHIDVQTDPGSFPKVGKGNPKLGAFAYKQDFDFAGLAVTTTASAFFPGVTTGIFVVAVHAGIVDKSKADPTGVGEVTVDVNGDTILDAADYTYESAWIDGLPFGGKNWAMYYQITLPVPAP